MREKATIRRIREAPSNGSDRDTKADRLDLSLQALYHRGEGYKMFRKYFCKNSGTYSLLEERVRG